MSTCGTAKCSAKRNSCAPKGLWRATPSKRDSRTGWTRSPEPMRAVCSMDSRRQRRDASSRRVTDRRVALLRGINVGTAKRVSMERLREVFERLGYSDVRTLLNSGNVVFPPGKNARADHGARIENAIADHLGVKTRVVVLRREEVVLALEDNPFIAIVNDPSRLLIMALREPKAIAHVRPLLEMKWSPEALALGKRV